MTCRAIAANIAERLERVQNRGTHKPGADVITDVNYARAYYVVCTYKCAHMRDLPRLCIGARILGGKDADAHVKTRAVQPHGH